MRVARGPRGGRALSSGRLCEHAREGVTRRPLERLDALDLVRRAVAPRGAERFGGGRRARCEGVAEHAAIGVREGARLGGVTRREAVSERLAEGREARWNARELGRLVALLRLATRGDHRERRTEKHTSKASHDGTSASRRGRRASIAPATTPTRNHGPSLGRSRTTSTARRSGGRGVARPDDPPPCVRIVVVAPVAPVAPPLRPASRAPAPTAPVARATTADPTDASGRLAPASPRSCARRVP